ncbi:MAG: O-methyltransferase [Flavitalea sp.]
MELINTVAQSYAERYSSALDPLLQEVADTTQATHPHSDLMSSRHQGKFLEIFSILLNPSRILEVGTFTGFSALCLAKGMNAAGKLHTIELRGQDAETAQRYFNRSNYHNQIILHTGNALEVIPELNETWDLAFIDADKPGYVNYYELILPKLRTGGVIIADNVLFHGQVLEEPVKGKSAIGIQKFNDLIANDDRVEQVMVTIRDGLMIIRKK